MKVIILSGIPGAGKTSYIKTIPGCVDTVSADSFFVGVDGVYRFDPAKLPTAHARCLRKFTGIVTGHFASSVDCLVVDNTNTTVAEIAPYYALAEAFGHEVEIVTIHCAPAIGAKRNVHGVSLKACQDMRGRIMTRNLPRWWKCTDIEESDIGRKDTIHLLPTRGDTAACGVPADSDGGANADTIYVTCEECLKVYGK